MLLGCALLLAAGCAHTGASTDEAEAADDVQVGYGTLAEEDVTGSISRVNVQEESHPARSVEELLIGRAAGVQVIETPDGFALRIRGRNSLLLDEEPLYVVDGVPVTPGPGGSINFLNPKDVEQIEVLKDASATAIYGMRGASGVILITTKRR